MAQPTIRSGVERSVGTLWSERERERERERLRELEAQLEEFDEGEVAAIGARVRAAVGEQPAVDAYEVALRVTYRVLVFRELHRLHSAPRWWRQRAGHVMEPVG